MVVYLKKRYNKNIKNKYIVSIRFNMICPTNDTKYKCNQIIMRKACS